jgi:CDP-4-dehydro-6-deoxyglucose reductase, E1
VTTKKGNREQQARQAVLRAVARHFDAAHGAGGPFRPGMRIPYGGRVFDRREVENLVDASLDFWLTAGRYAAKFEAGLARFLGVRHCSLTNSGSSANLLAFSALTSPALGERRIRRGDEVITVAAGFPTTVAPIVQHGAVPVFVDVALPTYNVEVDLLEKALSRRTRAVFLAHTLGNPFDLTAVREFCDRHGLWLVEDNCDALGAQYRFRGRWRATGSVGHLGTSSFYPPHHITMGEGGAVYTDDPRLKRLVESFRDWGRDCWCPPGQDNTCRRRFQRRFGTLPLGYDHKYVYSHFGYNLRITDMQAAIGCAQLEKLPRFVAARRENWLFLREALDDLGDHLVLPEPTPGSRPSWFGFLLTVRARAGFSRNDIVQHLENAGVQTRMLFAGNLLRHPCFDELRSARRGYRVVGRLANTERILNSSFWVGVYPGLNREMLEHVASLIRSFADGRGAGRARGRRSPAS